MQPGMEVVDRKSQALSYRDGGICMLGAGIPPLGTSNLLATPVSLGGGGILSGSRGQLRPVPGESHSGLSHLPAGRPPDTCREWVRG